MEAPKKYSFKRYLSSKVSVDTRALNQQVWLALLQQLEQKTNDSLNVLELGAGIGTMAMRFLDETLSSNGIYTLVEKDPALLITARESIGNWATANGFEIEENSESEIFFSSNSKTWQISFLSADLFDLISTDNLPLNLDLLIAHAFLDLVDIKSVLPVLFSSLNKGASFYFPINYDGLTIFEPAINPAFEDHLFSLYHRTMDQRIINGRPSGDSQTGRHLFQAIQDAGGQVRTAGSSDWFVAPFNNVYPLDEAYFLFHILETIAQELHNHPDLDQQQFDNWLALRRQQLTDGQLIYIAHQLDYFGSLIS